MHEERKLYPQDRSNKTVSKTNSAYSNIVMHAALHCKPPGLGFNPSNTSVCVSLMSHPSSVCHIRGVFSAKAEQSF